MKETPTSMKLRTDILLIISCFKWFCAIILGPILIPYVPCVMLGTGDISVNKNTSPLLMELIDRLVRELDINHKIIHISV